MSLTDFVPPPNRSLPIIVLADVSGSMTARGKLAAQTQSIGEMIDAFRTDATTRGAVQVAVVAFGGESAELVVELQPVEGIAWDPKSLVADGKTPWAAAISMARDIVDAIPEPTYQPTIVMTSDGIPTDRWEPALQQFLATRRGAQAHRYAIAIGEDADPEKLAEFTGSADRVLAATQASDIIEHFRRLTMSVTQALIRGQYESGLPGLTDDF